MQPNEQCKQGELGLLQSGSYIQQYQYSQTNSPTYEDNVLVYDDNSVDNTNMLFRSDSVFSENNCISGYTVMRSSSLTNIPSNNLICDISHIQSGPARASRNSTIRRSSTSPPPHMNHPYSPNSYHQSSPYYSNSPVSSPRSLSPSSSRQSPQLGSEQSRAESGLLLLTEKVIEYAKQSPKYEIDLQTVENKLGVPRRRLYDITNVLEAVGLFTKPRHNIYKLNMDISSGILQDEENDENIIFYTKSQFELERAISNIKDSIQDLIKAGQEQGLLYVDRETLSKLCPVNTNTVVSISTPIDSSIILNPNQHSYQLLNSILRTKNSHTESSMISVQSQILDSHWSILLKHQSSQLNVDVINGHANILEEVKQTMSPMKLPTQPPHTNPKNIVDKFLY
ncbi:transcription factor E2F dimerization partner [Cryptosporidium ubiquitum]|uniref:Transcription factor E2F dimerization partner n=1 Tax=Cryptosporidium ubiquitum TaxID=857276 RepID=A0A1J4MK63_9CRYT|nr:transcription factor E2F dimerization partner [Cryptosporidium ubiquitum]OII74598.1 transcription factor E2F dimerization partner [Cryptosporidium ubiquitum]